MAMSNKKKLDTLMKEIDNLVALLGKVDEGSEPVDTLTGQKQKVLDLLPVTPDHESFPMHRLLECKRLENTKIPLDVLEKLMTLGFNTKSRSHFSSSNSSRKTEHTCLIIAIRNEHYDAVRCLVNLGADCDSCDIEYNRKTYWIYDDDVVSSYPIEESLTTTPLYSLARHANAPLDLFDLLATPRSLVDDGHGDALFFGKLPVEIAITWGSVEGALRLIKLGAPIKYNYCRIMIQRYIDTYYQQMHDELFTRLIPENANDILQCIDDVLSIHSHYENNKTDIRAQQFIKKMILRLLQYIIPTDQMCLCFEFSNTNQKLYNISLKINNETLCNRCSSLRDVLWWSVLLVNLGWYFKSIPQPIVPLLHVKASQEVVQLAHRLDNVWLTYRDTRSSVTSLQNLCIQPIRRCMRDFSDDSFMSLPVSIPVRQLLMHQHVAEKACEVLRCVEAYSADCIKSPPWTS